MIVSLDHWMDVFLIPVLVKQ